MSDARSASLAALLAIVRALRHVRGLSCPRCGAARVVRWGGFAGRQRYRCKQCGRTFSDLTGSPAAYTKRLVLWPQYERCLAETSSVRCAAARLGIHPSTAFRWRHVLLDSLRAGDTEKVGGCIDIGSVWFTYSEKGRRGLERAARSRGVRFPSAYRGRSVRVVVACDRTDRVVSALSENGVSRQRLESALANRIEGCSGLFAEPSLFAACTLFARRLGATLQRMRYATTRAYAYGVCLDRWLQRFRGVATKYLSNYLVWHRVWRHGPKTLMTRLWPRADAFG